MIWGVIGGVAAIFVLGLVAAAGLYVMYIIAEGFKQ